MLSIVLSRKDFREHDQIVSLYVKENGKLSLIVRGVKNIDNKEIILLLDYFMVNLLYFLGFNFSSNEKIANSSILPYIEILEKGNLAEVLLIDFDLYSAKKIHKVIHNWFEHLLERKVADWALTCII